MKLLTLEANCLTLSRARSANEFESFETLKNVFKVNSRCMAVELREFDLVLVLASSDE